MFSLRRIRARLNRRGALSIEMLGIIAILGGLLAFSAKQMNETRTTSQATSLAHQLNMAGKGAQNYLDANSASLLAQLAGKNYLVVGRDNVKGPGGEVIADSGGNMAGLDAYMPVAFKHTSYGQDVAMYVYKGPDGALHALFGTTGGVPVTGSADDKRTYLNVARKASGMNGFGLRLNRTINNVPIESGAGAIVGQNDSWRFRFNDADYGSIPPAAFPEYQMAKPLYSFSAAIKSDMLYRVEVDGHPELNAMQTDLHMNGYQITDVGTITISQNPAVMGGPGAGAVPAGGNGLVIEPYNASGDIAASAQGVCNASKPDGFIFTVANSASGGQTANDMNGIWVCMGGQARLISDSQNSTQVKGVRVAKHGDTIKKPACPQGTTAAIYVSTAAFAEQTVKPSALTAVQTFAKDSGTNWQVNVRIKTTKKKSGSAATADAWTIPPTTGNDSKINYVMVQTTCERDNASL